jgi:enamine deaminase RidA (YjgF/YER057c/UK114 family)
MMMMSTETPEKLTPRTLSDWEALLPEVPAPLASYIPARRTGDFLYTAGVLPMVNGTLMLSGRVGQSVTVEQAAEAARQCVLNALAIAKAELGSLSQIKRVVKVVGFVMGTEDFAQHPQVINGASNALVEILGESVGVHARSAVGVYNLPLQSPVEIEFVFEVD